MSRRRKRSDEDDAVEINLSPMIDCIFILLIFFIVTTVFVEETGVEVNRPDASSSVQLEKNSILIAITANDKVVYGGKDIGVTGVGPQIKQLLLKEDIPVIIQADEGASHGIFAKVYGEAKLAGATKINFSTLR
jgi:biopolymer transport protein ExbD